MLDSFFNGSFFENVDTDDSNNLYYKQQDNTIYHNNPILQDNINEISNALKTPQKSVTWQDTNDSYSVSSSNDTYIQQQNNTSCKYKYYLLFAIIILTTSIGFFFFYK